MAVNCVRVVPAGIVASCRRIAKWPCASGVIGARNGSPPRRPILTGDPGLKPSPTSVTESPVP